ncbi:putative HTH-type transcriptional regulator [Baekduia alba]|uniref:winged helix-turn-helix transcriptional regulator n=1 Tax=Baekduia alba TaxID=2997333 RepID=UPI0023417410|nr:helix-turn-helix domain-containing protein [Baekduia alba]WCB95028.1 putative HTH-type transcriptional regulator [Baekduia alba]
MSLDPEPTTLPRPCAIADALELIGERWALLIVREQFWGNHRFSGIQRATGAPRDVLSARLRSLVDAGILEKRRYTERPPRDEYHLTARGRGLSPVLMAIQEWAYEELDGEGRARFPHGDHLADPVSHFTCRVCGKPLDGRRHEHAADVPA